MAKPALPLTLPRLVLDALARHPQSAPQRAFFRTLSLVLGGAEPARRAIVTALSAARLDRLPISATALVIFAHAHLTLVLVEHLGPRICAAFLEELALAFEREERDDDDDEAAPISTLRATPPERPASLHPSQPIARLRGAIRDESSAPPSARNEDAPSRSVGVVEPDVFARSSLARAFMRGSCRVISIDEASIESAEPFEVLAINLCAPRVEAVLAAILARRPRTKVVAYALGRGSMLDAREALRNAGVLEHSLVPAGAPLKDIVEAVERIAAFRSFN